MIIPSHIKAVMDESDRLGGPTDAAAACDLVRRWLDGDTRAWHEFSVRNSKLVTSIVKRWLKGGYAGAAGSFEDLWQEGMAGLLHAMGRIDESKLDGNPTSYCYPFILANIRRFSAKELSRGAGKSRLFFEAWANGDPEAAIELYESLVPFSITAHDSKASDHSDDEWSDPAIMFDLMDRIDRAMARMTADGHEDSIAVLGMRYGLWGGTEHTYKQIAMACGVPQRSARTLVDDATKLLAKYLAE